MIAKQRLYWLPRWLGLAATLLISGSPASFGHSNEYLRTIRGPHHGYVRMAEMYHFELVPGSGAARVWVTDHGDQPQSTAGATGTLQILGANGRLNVPLVPDGENSLVAKNAHIQPRRGDKALLTIRMKDQKPLQARYEME